MFTKETLLSTVKSLLGYPNVNLEVEDSAILSFIDVSISKIAEYSNNTCHTTITAQKCQNFDLGTVLKVYCNDDQLNLYDGGSDESSLNFDETKVTLYRVGDSFLNRKNIIIQQANQNFNSNVTIKTFKQIDNKLYIFNIEGTVIVEYIPKEVTLESLEPSLQDWVFRYTVALTKEAIGRVRSKYKANSSPFDIDGDTLVQEAQQSQQDLISELDDKGYGFFYIDSD